MSQIEGRCIGTTQKWVVTSDKGKESSNFGDRLCFCSIGRWPMLAF
jgi:hypothetical protein